MADCIVTIVGKNGMSDSFELSGISQSSEIQDIINALSESELRKIESFIKDPGNEQKLIELNSSQSEYAKQVIGNYNSESIESKLKNENSSFKGFTPYTKSLLNTVQQGIGNVNFILFSNLDYESDNAISDIQGAVLRYSQENPLLLIKGEDPDAIENTLRHELTHLLFNKVIESDKSLQDDINKMYDVISKKSKDLRTNPEIKDFITVVDILNLLNSKQYVPTETFAYLFQDENSYKYIQENFPTIWNKFNNLIELREPTSSIKNNGEFNKPFPLRKDVAKDGVKVDNNFRTIGSKILDKLGYKLNNRQPNGNIVGGQDGWKLRLNIKGNYNSSNDPEYIRKAEIITEKLKTYFGELTQFKSKGSGSEGYYFFKDGDGNSVNSFKRLAGGEFKAGDFTVYTGSYADTMKFIEDVKKDRELMDLLQTGEMDGDSMLDDFFKGRIEGSSIGFAGYHAQNNLGDLLGDTRIPYKNGTIIINSDNNTWFKDENETVHNVPTKKFWNSHPDIAKNLRYDLAYMLYGEYINGKGKSENTLKNAFTVNSSKPEELNEDIFNRFKKPEPQINVTFTKEQQQVIDEVNDFIENGDPDDFYVISGKAGTGKTTVAQAIALAFPNHSIITGAFTHQATSVIGGKFKEANLRNVDSYTLASMLGLRKDEKNNDFKIDQKAAARAPIKRAQIIIIDEASMIHEEHLEQIMENKPEDAKVIFLGDIGQLRPVRPDKLRKKVKDSKSPVFDKVKSDNISLLHTRIRQGEESPILPFADYYWNKSQHIKQPKEVENLNNNRETKITDKGALIFVNTANSIYNKMLELFKEGILNNNPNKIRYITYTNDDREEVNKSVREYIFGKDAPKYVKHELITFTNSLMSGQEVVIPNSTNAQIIEEPRYKSKKIFFQNNKIAEIRSIELTIKMGDYIDTIEVVDPRDSVKYSMLMASYKEYMNSQNKWRTSEYGQYLAAKNHFAEIDYGYAITSHKSQGSTFDVAIINEKNIMEVSATSDEVKAESIYTSLTRPKNVAVVISEKPINVGNIPDILELNNEIENNKKKNPVIINNSNEKNSKNYEMLKETQEIADSQDDNSLSFKVLGETQDFDKMMPHLKWDSETKTFENINDAYEFLESYKNDDVGLANVWSQPETVTNITQIANAKAGDILRMSSLDYLPVPKDGEVGLFGPAEWYGKMIPRTEMIRRIDQNLSDLEAYREKLEKDIENRNARTTDKKYIIPKLTDKLFNSIVNKQIKAKSKYYKYNTKTKTWGNLTEDGKKYLNLQPNYILARVFYDKVNNVYKGYVANKFKNSDEASCMLIDLDPSYIQSIRRMDDSFRQEYEYKDGELVKDAKGNPKIKKKSARYDISKVSDEDIELAKAGLVALSNIVDDLDTEIEAVEKSPELLEKYTFKNGNSIYKASPHGILISGFFGDLGDALKEASVGDYVKVLKSRNKDKSTNMTWATKVMDLPGGILVMMPSGEYKVVNENNATAVVFSKENLNKYLEEVAEIVDETKQMSRQERLFSSTNDSKDFSIYPFWAESDATKRADLAKTLKKGDYVKIMFKGKDGNPIEFVAPILFVTQTKIYYGTAKGEISSVDIKNYTEGKWVKKGDKWDFTGDVGDSFIRAAYVDHRKYKDALNYFTQYLDSANELRELPWTKEDHEYVTLDNLTDQLLGIIDNPQSHLQKTSISSEWAITEFVDSDINTKVRKVSNLIVGDLVKVAYEHTNTDNTTETRYKWGMVVGKDGKTNEPITAIYGKNGKVIVRRQSYDRIHSVGERSLPIYLNKETGEYSNYEKEGFEQISKGRPENVNRLREKYSEFFEKGLKLVNVSKDELEELRPKLMRNFGKKWEAVEMTYVELENGEKTWVMNFDKEKHTKIETDEVKYRIVGTTFNGKQYSIRQYQINQNTAKLYNAYNATFDQINSVVELGDLITYEVTTSKGTKMYVPGIVTEVTNSAIQISAIRVENNKDTGEKMYSNDTYTWFKNSKNQNIKVTEFYGSNYNAIYNLGKELSNKGKKSLDTDKFTKSFDNRETISLMSERLSKLYGINAILLTDQEMIEKGKEYNSNFDNVRGFALSSKNEIYINIDKASIAEPLHELSHLLMPGLKFKNPKAYNVMMDKIKDHPSYNDIAENYPDLIGQDLDEEVFVTIFAEYFREKMLSEEKNNWLSKEFFDLADNVPSVTSSLFDNEIDNDSNELMNMTLEEIMTNFGSAMISGRLKPLITTAINLHGNTDVQKIYKSLIDKGKLKKIC